MNGDGHQLAHRLKDVTQLSARNSVLLQELSLRTVVSMSSAVGLTIGCGWMSAMSR